MRLVRQRAERKQAGKYFLLAARCLVDLRGVLCPMNYLRARMALEEAEPHNLFEFLLDDEEGIRDVPKSLREDGYSILSSGMKAGIFHLLVRA